jgi:hypothetical protein
MPTTLAGTHLRCPTCGHIHPPRSSGIIIRMRAAGHEVIPTRILGRCAGCDKLKFLISEPDDAPSRPTPADRELTLQELAAYLSEDSMDISTVESIAAAACPEPRKRHVAALVAEGVLTPEEALRLLAI